MFRTNVTTGGVPARPEFRASTKVTAGVAVVTFTGQLEPSARPACRAVLDAIVRHRVPTIVLDLSEVQLSPESISMLTWMSRYTAHFGVTLTLIGVGRVVSRILERDHLTSLLRERPTDHAQRRATARAEHRDQWPTRRQPSALLPVSRSRKTQT